MKTVEFSALEQSDLIVDTIYKGAHGSSIGNEPLHKLLNCGTMGGFRYVGTRDNLSSLRFVVLYSSQSEPDWPDNLDTRTGQYTYYGDNRIPGYELEDTPKKGNRVLRECFKALHSGNRAAIPPFFIFTKGPTGRDVIYRGLAVPGALNLPPTEDLVAIWKSKGEQRFQNYRGIFTVLDEPTIQRNWIEDLKMGNKLSKACPITWKQWVNNANYLPLQAEPSIDYRTKEEQLPKSDEDVAILNAICSYFRDDPYEFEKCASELVRLMDKNFISYDLTRRWADGGRDALGKYRVGLPSNSIDIECALEAKCYSFNHGSGVGETSRLISRLRFRQFGIFVTTSYVSLQAYKEIVEDQHPVVVLAGNDIVSILKNTGYNTKLSVTGWLETYFPRNSGS